MFNNLDSSLKNRVLAMWRMFSAESTPQGEANAALNMYLKLQAKNGFSDEDVALAADTSSAMSVDDIYIFENEFDLWTDKMTERGYSAKAPRPVSWACLFTGIVSAHGGDSFFRSYNMTMGYTVGEQHKEVIVYTYIVARDAIIRAAMDKWAEVKDEYNQAGVSKASFVGSFTVMAADAFAIRYAQAIRNREREDTPQQEYRNAIMVRSSNLQAARAEFFPALKTGRKIRAGAGGREGATFGKGLTVNSGLGGRRRLT